MATPLSQMEILAVLRSLTVRYLRHGLVHSIDGHPGEVTAHRLGPEGVSGQEGGVQVEYLDSTTFIAVLEDLPRAPYHRLSHNYYHKAGREHAEGLVDIGPDNSSDSTQAGVEAGQEEGYQDGQVNL